MQEAVGFLGLPAEARDPEKAGVFVLPVPYEATVSYGTGTRGGPAALIAASQQVELYDPDEDGEPALAYGVHTLPAVEGCGSPEQMMEQVAAAAEQVARSRKLLLALGGEHSISPALVRGVLRGRGIPELTVVQIDAHADLRDSYLGTRYSHACAMRRIMEENPGPLVQVGVRSYSREEVEVLRAAGSRITFWSARAIQKADPSVFLQRLAGAVRGKNVYLTIDVDGLDPSVIPATGTPEPGGLGWQQTLGMLKSVAGWGHVIAVDCVELAPQPGLHMAEFAAARLLHEVLNRVMARER